MISPAACVLDFWAVWCVAWLLAARSAAKTVVRQSVASRLIHSVFIWGWGRPPFVAPATFRHPSAPSHPGPRLDRLGRCRGGRRRPLLQRLGWRAPGPVLEWTVTLKAEHALIRTGPYAVTRHPIYTGLLLALIATALVRGTLAAIAGLVLLIVGVMLKIRQEEQLLVKHFGAAYRAYQAELPTVVPRFLGAR